MSYGRFLKEHFIWALIFLLLLATIPVFCLLINGSKWVVFYTAAALLISYFLGTFLEYRREKRYFDGIRKKIDEVEEKYLVFEMLEEGDTREEEINKMLIEEMGKAMNEHIREYKMNLSEYKEYIEAWVHEIKIPIAAAQMMVTNGAEDPKALQRELKSIENYAEQALFYARSSAVEKDYLIKRVELRDLVQNLIRDKRYTLRSINAGIDLHDLDVWVLSDGKWLTFILNQIIDNSIKYRKDDVPFKLEIFATSNKDSKTLVIRDNGVGIKSAELGRVFDKGFTGTNGRAGKKSTGIGLYLCKKLCLKLEHNIRAESAEGEGTSMIITFPLSSVYSVTDQLTES